MTPRRGFLAMLGSLLAAPAALPGMGKAKVALPYHARYSGLVEAIFGDPTSTPSTAMENLRMVAISERDFRLPLSVMSSFRECDEATARASAQKAAERRERKA